MKLSKEDKKQLLELSKSKNIYLEGNIIKLIEGDDPEFEQYLKDAAEKAKKELSGVTTTQISLPFIIPISMIVLII